MKAYLSLASGVYKWRVGDSFILFRSNKLKSQTIERILSINSWDSDDGYLELSVLTEGSVNTDEVDIYDVVEDLNESPDKYYSFVSEVIFVES